MSLGTQRGTTCLVTSESEPTGWYEASFDDALWTAATEYTETEIGWGKAPSPQATFFFFSSIFFCNFFVLFVFMSCCDFAESTQKKNVFQTEHKKQ